jgi:hypothetical protein
MGCPRSRLVQIKGAGHLTRFNDILVNLMKAAQGTRPQK